MYYAVKGFVKIEARTVHFNETRETSTQLTANHNVRQSNALPPLTGMV